jgi:hypothetical protein
MAVAASSAARMSTAVRQPSAVVSQPVRGKKMLLANPATIVTVSRAELPPLSRSAGYLAPVGSRVVPDGSG